MFIASKLCVVASLMSTFVPSALCAQWRDINTPIFAVTHQLKTLTNAVDAFPANGGTVIQALNIYSDIIKVRQSYDTATLTVTNTLEILGFPSKREADDSCPPGQDSARAALLAVAAINSKKDAFASTPGGAGTLGLIKQELDLLSKSVSDFVNTWHHIAPANYKAIPASFKAQTDAAFEELSYNFGMY